MHEIKVGHMVELSNDFGTYATGRVNATGSGYYKKFGPLEPEKVLYYTISLEGISSDFYDYEWTVVSVEGIAA